MCNRYYMELSPELRPYIEAAERSLLREKLTLKHARPLVTRGEVKPGDIAPVIATSQHGRKAVYPMAFGFHSPTGSLILNARTETANQKPFFRESWMRRRCIIPASWYFEWEHFLRSDGKKGTGKKYMFQPAGEKIAWLCGLYHLEDGLPYFVILTRDATEDLQKIHDRMPLILPAAEADAWISPSTSPDKVAGLTTHALTNMVYTRAD